MPSQRCVWIKGVINMATYCVDYFATLGLLPDQQLLFQNISSFLSNKPIHPSLVWSSAITDINVIFYGKAPRLF